MSSPRQGAAGEKGGDGRQRVEIIPYHPSQIRIEKHGGKSASSMFCGTRKAAAATNTVDQQPPPASLAVSEVLPTMSVNSPVQESEFSDAISVVSELSDLSVMSCSYASPFRNSDTSKCGHPDYAPTFQTKTKHSAILPAVHGSATTCNHKQSFTRGTWSSNEKAYYVGGLLSSPTSQKHELVQLREDNFRLRRENVNLKSQVESLQNHQKSMLIVHQPSPSLVIPEVLKQQRSHEESAYEFRAQMRSAHDEIFRLQTEDTKQKMSLKNTAIEVSVCKQKAERLLKEKDELIKANADLTMKLKSKEEGFDSAVVGSDNAENQLLLLKSDLESTQKSKKWYEEQLLGAQTSRKAVEQDLIAAKLELSSKSTDLIALQSKLEETNYLLQEEKRNFDKEREDFKNKLRKIEVEMMDQESQLDQIQSEKDSMIAQLSDKLQATENEFTSVEDLSENIKELETDMIRLSRHLEDKEREIAQLTSERTEARDNVESLTRDLSAEKQSSLELDRVIAEMRQEHNSLQDRLQSLLEDRQHLTDDNQKHASLVEEQHQSLQSILSEKAEQENLIRDLAAREDQFSLKCQSLEQELLETRLALDDTHAASSHWEREMGEKAALVGSLETELRSLESAYADVLKASMELQKELEISRGREAQLQEDLNIMAMQLSNKAPDPNANMMHEELLQLRQSVQLQQLQLQQFENEGDELRAEKGDLECAKDLLAEKLMEAEKVYDEEVENLRDMVIQRDKLIESMRYDLEAVESDLCRTKQVLESNTTDGDRQKADQFRRLSDLEDALEEYEMTKRHLVEKEQSLTEALEKLKVLQEDNDGLVEQLDKFGARVDALEHENRGLARKLEEDQDAKEELREMYVQRIARLENFVSEYEQELEVVTRERTRLEGQIISLEAANGKLQSESVLNDSLREQLCQLQRDLKSDTSLREELVRNVEAVKTSLGEEIAGLESALRLERQQHAKTRETGAQLELENMELQQEVNGLQLRLEEESSRPEVTEAPRLNERKNEGESSVQERKVRELQHFLEEKERSVGSLEDHISTLKFHLQQKDAELEDAKRVLRASAEKYESSAERSRESERSLRAEITDQSRALEALAEERNNYRSQVQQQNLALRNSLEHIKQLRSQAVVSPAASAAYPLLYSSSSPSPLDDSMFSDLMLHHRASTPTPVSGNLTNLQNCLASLRAEMAILQVKLAPPGSNRRGGSTTMNGSLSSSPEAKDRTTN